MARTVTRQAIEDDARALADAEGDPNVTAAQLHVWVNLDIQWFWNLIGLADPDRCTQTASINTTAGTLSYVLPADFRELRSVDLVKGTDRIPIHQWIQQERYAHRNASSYLSFGQSPVHYRLMGQGIVGDEARIHFLPDPGTNTYEIRYIEVAPLLTTDTGATTGTLDAIAGWEHWISLRIARRIMKKQQRYEGEYESDIAEYEAQMNALLHNRDATEAPRIANVRQRPLFPAAR